MDANINTEVLQELRELRKDVGEILRQHGERIKGLETNMDTLIDNGQPGRITKLENDVESLSRFRYLIVGVATAISSVIHFVFPHK